MICSTSNLIGWKQEIIKLIKAFPDMLEEDAHVHDILQGPVVGDTV